MAMAEAVVRVAEVQAFKTKSGNTRFVLRDDDGNEYTIFRETIARQALAAEGRKARIEYHEEQRDGFTNVYLDKVEELPEKHADADRDVEEVAWKTAIDAAPWLVGPEQESRIPPEELFETLQPFKDLVAEDIREDG